MKYIIRLSTYIGNSVGCSRGEDKNNEKKFEIKLRDIILHTSV